MLMVLRGEFQPGTAKFRWTGGGRRPPFWIQYRYHGSTAPTWIGWAAAITDTTEAAREYTWWLSQKENLTDIFLLTQPLCVPCSTTSARRAVSGRPPQTSSSPSEESGRLPRLERTAEDARWWNAPDTEKCYTPISRKFNGVVGVSHQRNEHGNGIGAINDPDSEARLFEIYQGGSSELRNARSAKIQQRAGFHRRAGAPRAFVNLALERGYKLAFESQLRSRFPRT